MRTSENAITQFSGPWNFLSNFYRCLVEFEGATYPSVEHAYQAAKTLDLMARIPFQDALMRPGEAKAKGRKVALRADWENVKIAVMRECVQSKFTRSKELRERLIETGDAELIEGNNWGDDFYGKATPAGKNWLGQILMEVRAGL